MILFCAIRSAGNAGDRETETKEKLLCATRRSSPVFSSDATEIAPSSRETRPKMLPRLSIPPDV
eukprot:scaffold8194_cov248-Pinguiococcus_pyrenoidosus.AAC.4